MTTAGWVALQTYTTGLEADAVRLTLEDAEIPVLIPGQQVGIFGPGYHGGQAGGFTVLVPEVALADARAVLGLDDHDEED